MNVFIKLAEKISSKLSEKRKNELIKFQGKMRLYESMTDHEFMFEYISVFKRDEKIKFKFLNLLIIWIIVITSINAIDESVCKAISIYVDYEVFEALVILRICLTFILILIVMLYLFWFITDFVLLIDNKMLLYEVNEIRKNRRKE